MNTAPPFEQIPVQAKAQARILQNILDDPRKIYYLIGISVFVLVFSGMAFFWFGAIIFDKGVSQQEAAVAEEENEPGSKTDEQKKRDISVIQGGLKSYYTKNSLCPSLLNNLSPNYLTTIPLDPQTQQQYFYQKSLNGKSCLVKTNLTNGTELIKTVP